MKLDIQLFANPKLVIETELDRKNFENGLDKMKSSTQKAGSTIKNIVASLGITKMIGIAMNTINQSIDGAITRLDTLNQFPKVMSNLGIGAEEAQKSIDKMADKLSGLPTTLDEGARAVQRFTSKNGNVAKSTDLFLALNNAILAGGASAEIQSSALEQLSQSYAKGKPDMMEWRTAMTAMPAQLKQVAIAMGYVDADQLGQALREGTVSMDEFMDTITRLNTEGVNGFQSFEQQAKNSTGGIATSITVAKTQVIKGVTDIIEALNTKLADTEFGSLGNIIGNSGKLAKQGLDVIAKLIKGEMSLSEFMDLGTNAIKNFVDGFIKNLPSILETAKKLLIEFTKGFVDNLPILIESAKDLLFALVDGILDNLDVIISCGIDILLSLINGIVDTIPQLIDKIPEIITKIVETLTTPEMMLKLLKAGVELDLALGKGLIQGVVSLITYPFKVISSLAQSFKQRIQETDWATLGTNIIKGILNGFNRIGQFLTQKVNEVKNQITSKFKSIFGIHSPSRLMRDEIGIFLAQGIGEGFEDEIDNVYKSMQDAINFEQEKLQANVETGKVFNTLQNSTPIAIDINAPVELDGTKVGRLITPVVSKTIKTGGGV